jgi:hypothetical protein
MPRRMVPNLSSPTTTQVDRNFVWVHAGSPGASRQSIPLSFLSQFFATRLPGSGFFGASVGTIGTTRFRGAIRQEGHVNGSFERRYDINDVTVNAGVVSPFFRVSRLQWLPGATARLDRVVALDLVDVDSPGRDDDQPFACDIAFFNEPLEAIQAEDEA